MKIFCRRSCSALIFAVLGFGTLLHASGAEAAVTWQDVRSSVDIRGLATDGHVYVGAAVNGIWTSADLKTWQRVSLPATAGAFYNDILWDGSQFVAVGTGLITSPDGNTWTVRSKPTAAYYLNSLVFAGGIYLAVGSDGTKILRSTDGRSWSSVSTKVSLPTNWFLSLTGVGSNGSGFVALGNLTQVVSGITTFEGDELLTSPDGLTWTSIALPISGHDYFDTGLMNDVSFGAGTYAAGGSGGAYTSPDAITWSENFIPNLTQTPFWLFSRVSYLNGKFVAPGMDFHGGDFASIFTSSDGVTWSAKDLEPRGASDLSMSAVTYGGGQYVAGGYLGIYTSPDASAWTKVFTGPQTNFSSCILNGNGKFVIPGDYGAMTSSDGTSWPDALTATTQLRVISAGPGCGAFGAGVFVVLDSFGGDIQWSSDGSTWSGASLPISGATFTGIAWTGSQFIAVGLDSSGQPVVIDSSDGKSWTEKGIISTSGGTVQLLNSTNDSSDLVFVNGTLVAWGTLNGAPFTAVSGDGSAWTVSTSGIPVTTTIDSMAYGAGHYVAIGNDTSGGSVVLTSTDAIHWSAAATAARGTNTTWNTLIWGNNEFMAGGLDRNTSQGVYMTSADGGTWQFGTTDKSLDIYGLLWDGTQYIAAADDDILQFRPQSSGGGGGSGGGSSGGKGGGGDFGIVVLGLLGGLAGLRRRLRSR